MVNEAWLNQGSPYGRIIVGSFVECSVPVNIDKSPEVDEWHSKIGSRINNRLFTDTQRPMVDMSG